MGLLPPKTNLPKIQSPGKISKEKILGNRCLDLRTILVLLQVVVILLLPQVPDILRQARQDQGIAHQMKREIEIKGEETISREEVEIRDLLHLITE